MEDYRRHLDRGFNWLGGAAVIARIVDLCCILIVLLYLTKEEVGVAALVVSLGSMIDALDGLGTGDALVQASAVTARQRDTVFWFNIATALLVAALTAAFAPLAATLFGAAGMAGYLTLVAVKQPVTALAVVPVAMLNRTLAYERIALINVTASLVSATTRAGLAVAGGGAWALVAAYAAHGLVLTIGAWIASPFRPHLCFDWRAIRPLVRFGMGSASSNLFEQMFKNIDFLLIGWFYGPAPLAIYRVAFDLAMEPAMAVSTLIHRTALPVFARVAAEADKLAAALTWSLGRIASLVAPLTAGLVLAADPLMQLLHDSDGHSYAAAALPLKILATAALLRVALQLMMPVLIGSGRPGVAARLSALTLLLLSGGILAACLLFPVPDGIVAASLVWLLVYPPLMLWGVLYVKRHWSLRLQSLLQAFIVPLAGMAALLIMVKTAQVVAGGDARTLAIIVAGATLATYGGQYLWSRRALQAPA